MNLVEVESSNINAVGYDQDTKKMVVEFKGGGQYEYTDVPFDVYTDLMDSDSVGQTFHKTIRGKYEFEKL